jgi:hypothetical protein
LAIKQLRYGLEHMAPAFQQDHEVLVNAVKDLQEHLGRHHDAFWLEERLLAAVESLRADGLENLGSGLSQALARLVDERHHRYAEFVSVTEGLTAASLGERIRLGLWPQGEALPESAKGNGQAAGEAPVGAAAPGDGGQPARPKASRRKPAAREPATAVEASSAATTAKKPAPAKPKAAPAAAKPAATQPQARPRPARGKRPVKATSG